MTCQQFLDYVTYNIKYSAYSMCQLPTFSSQCCQACKSNRNIKILVLINLNLLNFFNLEYSLLTCYDIRADCVTYDRDLYCTQDPDTQADCQRYCGLCSSNNH